MIWEACFCPTLHYCEVVADAPNKQDSRPSVHKQKKKAVCYTRLGYVSSKRTHEDTEETVAWPCIKDFPAMQGPFKLLVQEIKTKCRVLRGLSGPLTLASHVTKRIKIQVPSSRDQRW